MKKVITYGTYDLFHQGHYNLLKNAKALGDYLIVGVTSDDFDKNRGKLNVRDSLMTRIKAVEDTGFADEIIVEEYFGQKIDDIKKYNIDIFTVGSDWAGHFDYLNEYCQVVYLERTKGISSTDLRNKDTIRIGIWGSEKIVFRFHDEAKFVSGVELGPILSNHDRYIDTILANTNLNLVETEKELLEKVDAVYINLPPVNQYEAIVRALQAGKHVLCEFPVILSKIELEYIYKLAGDKNLIFFEGLKTAYCPGFNKLLAVAKSGIIGNILSIDANFTQILDSQLDEQVRLSSGGSVNALGSYPLLVFSKFFGNKPREIQFISRINDENIDTFSKIICIYNNALATGQVAINAKSEGSLVITGDKGCLYIPAPWWKTEYFEVRFEDSNRNRKYFYKFEGEGLRYEIAEFARCLLNNKESIYFTREEVEFISSAIKSYEKGENRINI